MNAQPIVGSVWSLLQIGTDRYLFRHIPTDWGRGFELRKVGTQDVYHVNLDDNGFDDCDCKGFVAHQRCKHVAALRRIA